MMMMRRKRSLGSIPDFNSIANANEIINLISENGKITPNSRPMRFTFVGNYKSSLVVPIPKIKIVSILTKTKRDINR